MMGGRSRAVVRNAPAPHLLETFVLDLNPFRALRGDGATSIVEFQIVLPVQSPDLGELLLPPAFSVFHPQWIREFGTEISHQPRGHLLLEEYRLLQRLEQGRHRPLSLFQRVLRVTAAVVRRRSPVRGFVPHPVRRFTHPVRRRAQRSEFGRDARRDQRSRRAAPRSGGGPRPLVEGRNAHGHLTVKLLEYEFEMPRCDFEEARCHAIVDVPFGGEDACELMLEGA
mmetsp:Transcript_29192/g.55341  ORF Transcript_29192/g.55341 Transcript_29192/m.55341 type:complete len:226 (-) Transcript_29192:614-1291(-)